MGKTQGSEIQKGGLYTREVGIIWQIGVLAQKPCSLLVPNRSVIFGILALKR